MLLSRTAAECETILLKATGKDSHWQHVSVTAYVAYAGPGCGAAGIPEELRELVLPGEARR